MKQPFDNKCWFFLLITIITVALVTTIVDLIRNKKVEEKTSNLIYDILVKLFENLANLFATLLEERIPKFLKTERILKIIRKPFLESDFIIVYYSFNKTQKILNIFWTFAVLTIPAFYSSFIFAKIVSQPLFVVDSFEDVAFLPEIEMTFTPSAFGSRAVCSKIAEEFPNLWSQITSGQKRVIDLNKKIMFSEESFDAVLEGKRLVSFERTILAKLLAKRDKMGKKCGFYLSKPQYTYLISMLFNKGLKKQIRNVVNKK